jgi:hypothetical protein
VGGVGSVGGSKDACVLSNLQSPISNLQSPISNLQSPISNLQSPISNLQSPKKFPISQTCQPYLYQKII